MKPRIVILPGYNRASSYNRKLATEAARILARTDAIVTMLNLADYPLPVYDGDEEEATGIPQNAVHLAHRLSQQDALLIVSPEYNGAISPLLKNALDWASRVRKVEGRPIKPFKGLVAALASASPGRFGGMRGLETVRPVMRALGAEVLTAQCCVGDAASAFDTDGRLIDDRGRLALEALAESLLDSARGLSRSVLAE